ncbi:MAG: tryptophan-rich sensory protein [Parcubacteria group bacterium]
MALWLSFLITFILFFKEKKAAVWLMTPYIAWVSFAAVLNYFIYILN